MRKILLPLMLFCIIVLPFIIGLLIAEWFMISFPIVAVWGMMVFVVTTITIALSFTGLTLLMIEKNLIV